MGGKGGGEQGGGREKGENEYIYMSDLPCSIFIHL